MREARALRGFADVGGDERGSQGRHQRSRGDFAWAVVMGGAVSKYPRRAPFMHGPFPRRAARTGNLQPSCCSVVRA